MRFEGVCYDGPWEGQQIAKEEPHFKIAIYYPLVAAVPPNWDDPVLPPMNIPISFYRWQRDLKKWVFDPQGESLRHAYRPY